MLKLIKKLINYLCTDDDSVNSEPEFLGEYWVYYGTKGFTTVYAKSSAEAKYKAICTKACPVDSDEVYAVYKRISSVKNPAYAAHAYSN